MPSFVPLHHPADALNIQCDLSFYNNNNLLLNTLCMCTNARTRAQAHTYTHTWATCFPTLAVFVNRKWMMLELTKFIYLFSSSRWFQCNFLSTTHRTYTHTHAQTIYACIYACTSIYIYIFNPPNIAGMLVRYLQFINICAGYSQYHLECVCVCV